MELTKHRSRYIKLAFLYVILILITSSATSGLAVEYHFVEDFSDSQLDEWTFTGQDFNNQVNDTPSGIKAIPPTVLIENEELVSSGNLDIRKTNAVSIRDNTVYGGWSFDLYIPSSYQPNTHFNYDVSIMMSRLEMGTETLHPIFALNIRKSLVRLMAFNETDVNLFGLSKPVSNIEVDKLQRFDLIRTLDRFYVFIDKTLAANWTFSLNLNPSVNYFSIIAIQGSNFRFDNIQITTDATGLLNEVLGNGLPGIDHVSSTSSTESVTSTQVATIPSTSKTESVTSTQTGSSPTSTSTDSLILSTGSSIVALIGSVIVWKRIHNKKISNLTNKD